MAKKNEEKSPRKVRPRLRPISVSPEKEETVPENVFIDGLGLGFGDIVTAVGAATSNDATHAAASDLLLHPNSNDALDSKQCGEVERGTKVGDENKNNGRKESCEKDPPTDVFPSDASTRSNISSSDSSRSSNSWSSDDMESEASNHTRSQTQLLEREIRARQKRLAKILRGKEGTSYAVMMKSQENRVNSQLLSNIRQPKPLAPLSVTNSDALLEKTRNDYYSKASKGLFQTFQTMLVEHCHHSIPGVFSLILHCILYITIHKIIGEFLLWTCDVVVISMTGWHVTENYFDSSPHENLFFLAVMILSIIASKVTGVLYDWNENRSYNKRVQFSLRNKWLLKFWDAKLINFFLGGELCKEYEFQTSKGQKQHKRYKWGPRLKHILDLISFFICYICVEHFISTLCVVPICDITESVMAGLPSQQVPELSIRHSYACSNVASALNNPFALDMLKWITSLELESEEAKNWIKNAEQCGWSDFAEQKDSQDEENESCGVGEVAKKGDIEQCSNEHPKKSSHAVFLRQKRIMSTDDGTHIQATVSLEAYYDLVGDPNPRFIDQNREMLFFFVSAASCFGLMYFFDIPFLLI